MKYINSKLKSKIGPLLLAGTTALLLLGTLILSSTYTNSVQAGDANITAGQAVSNTLKTPPATSTTKPATTSTSKPAPVVKNPSNLGKSTAENVDESGKSGFVICGNTVDTPCNVTHLFRIFIIIINYLISMAGLVAILFIVIGGIQMIASQGLIPGAEANQTQLTAAKKRLTGAVTGLVLVAIAFVLVNSLLAGSLNIGIKNGATILTNPRAYINQCVDGDGNVIKCDLPSQTNPTPEPTTKTNGTTQNGTTTGK